MRRSSHRRGARVLVFLLVLAGVALAPSLKSQARKALGLLPGEPKLESSH